MWIGTDLSPLRGAFPLFPSFTQTTIFNKVKLKANVRYLDYALCDDTKDDTPCVQKKENIDFSLRIKLKVIILRDNKVQRLEMNFRRFEKRENKSAVGEKRANKLLIEVQSWQKAEQNARHSAMVAD